MIKTFRDLEVYQEAYELAIIINRNVNKLPLFERNDLGLQLRKASKSAPANIAEGWQKDVLASSLSSILTLPLVHLTKWKFI